METEGAQVPANGRIRWGLMSEPSLKVGGYDLDVDVEEKEVLPQSLSRI